MPVGQTARRVLGPAFPVVGAAYRRVFVDVRKVARAVPLLPDGATLLDVGGGDGAILNPLLDRQPGLRVVAVDVAPVIGSVLRGDLRDRVELHPSTSVSELVASVRPTVDAALLSDVLHHVPPAERAGLVADVLAAFGSRPRLLVVKDLIPQGARARLAFWADRNITGERQVEAVSPVELVDLVRSVWPGAVPETTDLQDHDFPNYCLVFREA